MYDSISYKVHGSRAVLNFPLDEEEKAEIDATSIVAMLAPLPTLDPHPVYQPTWQPEDDDQSMSSESDTNMHRDRSLPDLLVDLAAGDPWASHSPRHSPDFLSFSHEGVAGRSTEHAHSHSQSSGGAVPSRSRQPLRKPHVATPSQSESDVSDGSDETGDLEADGGSTEVNCSDGSKRTGGADGWSGMLAFTVKKKRKIRSRPQVPGGQDAVAQPSGGSDSAEINGAADRMSCEQGNPTAQTPPNGASPTAKRSNAAGGARCPSAAGAAVATGRKPRNRAKDRMGAGAVPVYVDYDPTYCFKMRQDLAMASRAQQLDGNAAPDFPALVEAAVEVKVTVSDTLALRHRLVPCSTRASRGFRASTGRTQRASQVSSGSVEFTPRAPPRPSAEAAAATAAAAPLVACALDPLSPEKRMLQASLAVEMGAEPFRFGCEGAMGHEGRKQNRFGGMQRLRELVQMQVVHELCLIKAEVEVTKEGGKASALNNQLESMEEGSIHLAAQCLLEMAMGTVQIGCV